MLRWTGGSADDLVVCLGDLNEHIDGFDDIHGAYGASERNMQVRILSEFVLEINYTC